MAPRLYLNHAAGLDMLTALEFGRVGDGMPSENRHLISEHFAYYFEQCDACVGFKVLEFSTFDAEASDVTAIWSGPLFDSPTLGMSQATAGQIVVAARTLFGGEPSVNQVLLSAAMAADSPEDALPLWRACLEAGDSMAHFAIGHTLYYLGRFQEAYQHLRHYTEISPVNSRTWCWFGKGAQAIGELDEARAAFARAIEIEGAGDDETDARELLEQLGHENPTS
jgi:tetratricopeptide (TPR) repeat protein